MADAVKRNAPGSEAAGGDDVQARKRGNMGIPLKKRVWDARSVMGIIGKLRKACHGHCFGTEQ
ncbi:hypothetical protein EIP86_005708 [Pleurotus ostreatoroseus]|nr:hypothetical protein EIP86_005708 [Pleurotus ostreatoroseus]